MVVRIAFCRGGEGTKKSSSTKSRLEKTAVTACAAGADYGMFSV